MVQVSGGQLITSTGQPIMVQAMSGQGQTLMQVPVSGSQGLQQVGFPPSIFRLFVCGKGSDYQFCAQQA